MWNKLIEGIFGKFKKPSTERKKRYCVRCRVKYDPAKAPVGVSFDRERFCSYECAVESASYVSASRQKSRRERHAEVLTQIRSRFGLIGRKSDQYTYQPPMTRRACRKIARAVARQT